MSLVLSFILAASAWADQNGPCKVEGPQFCPQKKFGHGEVFRCLLQIDPAKLSAGCRDHLENMVEDLESCLPHLKSHCPASLKTHTARACLGQHQAHLPAACKKDLGF